MTHPDDELKARFRELRDHDVAQAPAFRVPKPRDVSRAPAVPRAILPAPVWWASAAGVLFAALGVALLRWDAGQVLRRFAGSATPAVEAPSISDWTSPTASLLRTPGYELLAPPPILSSLFDGVTPRSGQRQGATP